MVYILYGLEYCAVGSIQWNRTESECSEDKKMLKCIFRVTREDRIRH